MNIEVVTIEKVFQTKVWIESDTLGSRHVMVQYEGREEPFTYATFFYDYLYTDNANTRLAAETLAISLGATAPVEHRPRDWHVRPAKEQGMMAPL